MEANSQPLARRQYLVTAENLRKIKNIARQSSCSATEVVRRAIDAYDPERNEEPLLDALAETMHQNVKEALESTRRANRVVAEALARLETAQNGRD